MLKLNIEACAKQTVVTNRFAKAEEVAKTILWLATESPEYINNGSFPR